MSIAESNTDQDVSALSLDQQVSLLNGADFWRTRAITEHGIAQTTLSDGPHGIRAQENGGDHLGIASSTPSTCFPTAVTTAASWNPALLEDVGAAVGLEARALGVDVVLGPGLNLKRHPLCGRNFEYSSEDPLLSGVFAAASVRGIQSTGAGACLKHFAVNNQEHRRFVIDAIVDERTMRELYLRGFERAVKTSKPATVMAAYNLINGEHATDSRNLLTTILRDEWGFDGLVMSDWGAEADRVAGVAAGMDLEMPGGSGTESDLHAALEDGRLSAADVTLSASRVAALARYAERARAAAPIEPMEALVDKHDALARHAAAASAVVLRNEGVLPLQASQPIALIGAFAEKPRFQGSGSSLVTPTRVTTARAALEAAGVSVTYAPGYDPSSTGLNANLLAEAVEAARGAEVAVVMVGLTSVAESEGFDRDSLALPAQHDALVSAVAAVAQRTVVVLSLGAPVALPWRDDVDAIVVAHLGGQASGGAVADLLLGVVEPAGRLTETWFAQQADIAADPFFPGGLNQVEYREGIFVGYRHSTTAGVTVQFPFGFGLGYGATKWSRARVSSDSLGVGDTVTVSVEVANTGDSETSDVVQVYSHDRSGVVLRPRRELVGFAHVILAAGETRAVEVTVSADDLAFWDVRSHSWALPTGVLDFEIARSAHDIESTVSIQVLGTVTDSAEPPATLAIAVSDDDFVARLGRDIPTPRAQRPFTRESTVGDLSGTIVGRALRSGLRKAMPIAEADKDDPGTIAMMERSVDELPLRGLAQMSGGQVTWKHVDAILALANRHPLHAVRVFFGRR